jgi:quercetin dioxygenase-like cupin family protein
MHTTTSTVSSPDSSEKFAFLGEVVAIRIDGESTGGAFALLEHLLPQGLATPLHVQRNEDETFYVLEGEITVYLDGEVSRAAPGDVVWLPRGLPHAFQVESEHARLLGLSTPAGHERFFALAGEPTDALALEAQTSQPPDFARMNAAAETTGVEILAPPPFPGN